MRSPPREFPPDEILYRRLDPEFWDKAQLASAAKIIYSTAFLDEGKSYTKLSLYFGSIASPKQVLEITARMSWAKKAYGNPSAGNLWEFGYGIGRICIGSAEMGQTGPLVKLEGGIKNYGWIYRIPAKPGKPRGGIVPPIPVLAPGSALGSRPRVALSSAQAV